MEAFKISVQRFDEFASEYAEKFNSIDSYRKHFDTLCDMIETDSPTILELACGPGNVTKYLKHRFPNSQILAIDLAPRMIEIAKQNIKDVTFTIMDIREIHSLNDEFDMILCSFGLPFLSKTDSDTLIANCSKKLKKHGLLYISTMEGDESKAGFESTSFSGDSQVYFNYHTLQDLLDSLENNTFSIEYSIRQNYYETNETVSIDLILIAKKK